MPGVGDHALRVESVASGALGDGHAQVGVQADAGDAHAGIRLVFGGQVDIVMVVVVVMTQDVRVAVAVAVAVVVGMVRVTAELAHDGDNETRPLGGV